MNNRQDAQELHRSQFGNDFKWGVAVSAYQTEGAHDADGKGHSIWDVFTNKRGKVNGGENGNTACDFYNRYNEDIRLMKALGIPNFRFSLSWPRILPTGHKPINQAGLDFYERVIDYCLSMDIEPWVTLYHWDLPHEIEKKGGWTNPEVVNWFSEYVEVCVRKFGDRVKNWMVMNEPMVFVGAGYFLGVHAPGRTGMRNFLPAIHHAVLSISEGGRIIKSMLPDANVGTTFSCSHIEPATAREKDVLACYKVDALLNRLFIEPVLGLGYPTDELKPLRNIEKYMKPGDEKKMSFDFDFIGVQNYTREIVRHSFFTPYLKARIVPATKRKVDHTLMKWEVYPPCIYHILKKFDTYPQIKKLIVTENGAAFPDQLVSGQIQDTKRREYLKSHIEQVLKAKQEGVKVEGYFIWTFTDNFEWAEGFHPRFGIVYVDFKSQERIVKSSGAWFSSLLKQE